MPDPIFVDTNVLVYARDTSEAEKQPKADAWMSHLWSTRAGRLSIQVLHEFYVTVTQKLRPGLDREIARQEVRDLMTWRPLLLDRALTEGAWGVQDRHGLSWWDSLIVSAAQIAGCRYLLTEDLSDGQRYDDVVVVNPFLHDPDFPG
jgi:predicted nucleic acid-binding protein